ncbi:MAG: TRAP transporter large permease subunit, partial [Sphaerochaetaceae bacterium]|nr:TRAP transporter large permease subunit [Sphaerochaetaceae bacterium]
MSITLVLFGTLIILLLLKVPVSFALALSSAAALLWEGYTPLMQVIQRMYAGANSWLLLAIPFFMLA